MRYAFLGALLITILTSAFASVSQREPEGTPTSSTHAVAASQPDENPLSNRRGPAHERALQRFGGDRHTETAVADGLAWLAAHQRPDGMWDREGFSERCPVDDRCPGEALRRTGRELNVGLSALATLAFLGAGYTHDEGPYAATVTRAFEYLIAQQTPDGTFAEKSDLQMYNDALATLATAEAYAMTRDPIFERPLRRAVAHLTRSQQNAGGWDYTAVRTGRNDTSISGFVLMALRSAAVAGVEAPPRTIWRMIGHFERAVEIDGRVWYADEGTGVQTDRATGERRQRYGPAMTAVGLFAHTAIGWRPDDAIAMRQVRMLLDDPPSYERMTRGDPSGLHSEYYWYYGTLALFHVGGQEWFEWNKHLKNCILEYQDRSVRPTGQRRHIYGSWQPYALHWGKWGRMGGRVYSTAINVLTLEIYYRYVPAYLSPHGIIGPNELRRYVEGHTVQQRRELIPGVVRFHADTSEPVLLGLLRSEEERTRLAAALALAELGSPVARHELLRQRRNAIADVRDRVEAAIRKLDGAAAVGEVGRVTRVNTEVRMFLFETQGRAVYYEQAVEVVRDGRTVAKAKVERRFTPQRAAAATIVEGDVHDGDAVMAAAASD